MSADAVPLNWREKSIVLTTGLSTGLCNSVLLPILPDIQKSLSHHPGDAYLVKLVQTSANLGMLVGALTVGALSDRLGRRQLLIIALLIYALSGAAGLFLDNLSALIGARLIVGLASGAIFVLGIALIGDHYDGHRRARMMGLNVMVPTISIFLLTPLSGLLGNISWHLPFLFFLYALPVAALTARSFNRQRPKPPFSENAAVALPFDLPWGLVIFGLCSGIVTHLPSIYLPFRVRELGAQNATAGSLAVTASILTVAIGAALYGQLRKRISIAGMFLLTFAFTATGAGITALSSTIWAVILGSAIFGLGAGTAASNLMTAAAGYHQRGKVVGAVKSINLASPIIGIALLEPLSVVGGAQAALLGIVGLSIVLMIASGQLIRTKRWSGQSSAEGN